jgi:hypothetical protein
MVEKECEVMTVGDFPQDPYQWTFPKGYYYPQYPSYNWTFPTTRKVVTEKFYDKDGNLTHEIVTETFSTNYGQTYGVSSTTNKFQIDSGE